MQFSKTTLVILSLSLLVVLFALPVAIPSGAVTNAAQQLYEDNMSYDELSDAADVLRANWGKLDFIASAAMSDILPANDIAPLPLDNSPGRPPIEENFTETGYRDDTIIVEMEKKRMFDSDVFIAYVKIATPSQLRTTYAGTELGSTRTNHTSRLSANYHGIVAINGDYYAKTKAGYIVRQGETYREKTSDNMDLLFIDEMGDFHIILRGHDNQKAAIKEYQENHEIMNGFFFGPALVVDGQVQEIPEKYQFDPHAKNPRAAIGQTGPLTYVVVAVNGRMKDSAGVTATQLAEIMKGLDCEQAYNLDGGNSATLAFNGAVYNDKPQDERSVTDIIYFATATEQ